MKRKTYPKYKPSGVEWLGDVPEHWESKRFGFLFLFFSGGTPSTGQEAYWDGSLPWVSAKDMKSLVVSDTEDHISEDAVRQSATCKLPSNSVLIVNRSGILKHSLPVAVISREMAINQDIRGCVPIGTLETKFIAYLIDGNQKALLALWRQQGATVESLSFESVKATNICIPPPSEQRAITAFLDRETGRIDTLIAKKRELVERLREKRTALISHTVTHGLPPDAAAKAGLPVNPPLKPSGIEWLGDIPEHWEVKRLKYLSPRITVGIVVEPSKYYVDDGIPALRSLNVKPHRLVESDLVFISQESNEQHSKSKIYEGDLVAVRSGQPGTTAVVDKRFHSANCIDLIIIRKPYGATSAFLDFFLNSDVATAQFETGTGGAIQQHFNITTAASLQIIVPPLPEQVAIAAHLNAETMKLDALTAKIEEAVERLQEYRTALITAAVTGRINVHMSIASAVPNS